MLINFADKAVLGLAAVPIMHDLALPPMDSGLLTSRLLPSLPALHPQRAWSSHHQQVHAAATAARDAGDGQRCCDLGGVIALSAMGYIVETSATAARATSQTLASVASSLCSAVLSAFSSCGRKRS
jgi:hypothetical protein